MSVPVPTALTNTDAARSDIYRLGKTDHLLKKGECYTYFRRRFNKCSNFALENRCVPFDGPVTFGGTSYATLKHNANLLYWTWIVLDLPALRAVLPDDKPLPKDGSVFVHWTNAVAMVIVKEAKLSYGNTLIDTVQSISMYMWEELSGKAGKRLTEMIGKRKMREDLIKDAARRQRLYLPLPFSHTLHPGNVIPLDSLRPSTSDDNASIRLTVHWEELSNCVVVSHKDVQVYKPDGYALKSDDLLAHVDVTYVHLDHQERSDLIKQPPVQLITQTQVVSSTPVAALIHEVPLPLVGPVMDMAWVVRLKDHEDCNDWFNFEGFDKRDPIEKVALKVGNKFRFGGHEGRYYRLVEPYQTRNNIPEKHIYYKSWNINGEMFDPTGFRNFASGDNPILVVELQPELKDKVATIIVVARSHQIITYNGGRCETAISEFDS